MKLVKPITCRKCKGSGTFVRASGMPDNCWPCLGAGVVEGDKPTLAQAKAAQAEHDRIYGALRDLARADKKVTYMINMASDGLYILQAKEPERAAKAIASIQAGHPGVVKALAEYYKANH
ncbi:hypothetical protein [Arthrobacter sp. ES1]|uniref:hypothetical protein n=1 Tax=Arthrobacter sp. ES1 TaxID=1897056 RepID=UPI001CFFA858|nr:hypothetical protein [Arthrobacter sp. ES1]MCB5280588.1 hypothetical protein [Arthrobacter sp. ES1]